MKIKAPESVMSLLRPYWKENRFRNKTESWPKGKTDFIALRNIDSVCLLIIQIHSSIFVEISTKKAVSSVMLQ
jgi:hypothetical protein